MARLGYARVSGSAQDFQAQVDALRIAGCERIYSEKASGKSVDGRPQFKRLMRDLMPGDVVHVVKLDRLARSTRDLMNILHDLDAQGCGFVSLGESWCDTTSDVGRLVVTIMAGIAEFERKLIRSRTEAGIERAKAKGTKFGRKRSMTPEEIKTAAERYANGETQAELAEVYGVSEATMFRRLAGHAAA